MIKYPSKSVFVLILVMAISGLSMSYNIKGCCGARLVSHLCSNVPNERRISIPCFQEQNCSYWATYLCMDGTTINGRGCCDRAECWSGRLGNGCLVNGKCYAGNLANWNATVTKFAVQYKVDAYEYNISDKAFKGTVKSSFWQIWFKKCIQNNDFPKQKSNKRVFVDPKWLLFKQNYF